MTKIEELQQKINELQAELDRLKTTKWEPEKGGYFVCAEGDVMTARSTSRASEFGTERKTRELAKAAAAKMRRFNRLLAYVDEVCGGYEWVKGESNCYIYFDDNSKPQVSSQKYVFNPSTVYMPHEVALELCKKMESGEVEL